MKKEMDVCKRSRPEQGRACICAKQIKLVRFILPRIFCIWTCTAGLYCMKVLSMVQDTRFVLEQGTCAPSHTREQVEL